MGDSTAKSVFIIVGLAAGFALLPRALDAMRKPNMTEAADFDAKLMPSSTKATLETDAEGVKLSGLRGKPVMLDFTASWCSVCQQQSPIVNGVAQRFQDKGLVVVGIDTAEDDRAWADKWVQRKKFVFPIAFDEGNAIARRYGVDSLPTVVVISKEGKVIAVRHGMTSDADLETLVKRIL
jgi:peroxiredoxin